MKEEGAMSVPASPQRPKDPESRNRPKTMSRREMLRERRRRERAGELLDIVEYDRPKVRAGVHQWP